MKMKLFYDTEKEKPKKQDVFYLDYLCPECGRELKKGQKCPECGKTAKKERG